MPNRLDIVRICSEAKLTRSRAASVAEEAARIVDRLGRLLAERRMLLLWTAELEVLPVQSGGRPSPIRALAAKAGPFGRAA